MSLHIHHRRLVIVGIIFLSSWVIGTFLIHYFERAQGWSYFDALYFTVITTATIGFGDLVPHTMAGKILTMWYAMFYVPLFLYTMNILFQSRFDRIRVADDRLERELHDVEADVSAIIDNTSTSQQSRRRITSK